MNIAILFENDDVCVIEKPSGLTAHSDGARDEATVADWFLSVYPETKNVGEPLTQSDGTVVYRPGIVHRLDKGTSGVMILAKTQEAFLYLKEQFQGRHAKKTYRAFLWGEIKSDTGVIDKPIGRSRADFRKKSAEYGAKPPLRESITHYTVLKRTKGFTYIEAKPETGRMHQLRVHFKAVGNPIVCDKLYMPNRECALGFERLALHAYSLELSLPDGERHTFTAPLPPDFVAAELALN